MILNSKPKIKHISKIGNENIAVTNIPYKGIVTKIVKIVNEVPINKYFNILKMCKNIDLEVFITIIL